jgi:hypothetical protein
MGRQFLWAGNQQLHGGKCKVNWVRVGRPLHRNGLGITDLEHFGHALRLRWLWFQWTAPDKPWCGSDLPIDSTDDSLFTAATRVQVHYRCKAKFWTSSWLNGSSSLAMFPTLYLHSKQKNQSVAEALHNDNWIWDLMHNLTISLFADYVLLWTLVDAEPIHPLGQIEDEITCTRTTDGIYSVNSAYEMQFD